MAENLDPLVESNRVKQLHAFSPAVPCSFHPLHPSLHLGSVTSYWPPQLSNTKPQSPSQSFHNVSRDFDGGVSLCMPWSSRFPDDANLELSRMQSHDDTTHRAGDFACEGHFLWCRHACSMPQRSSDISSSSTNIPSMYRDGHFNNGLNPSLGMSNLNTEYNSVDPYGFSGQPQPGLMRCGPSSGIAYSNVGSNIMPWIPTLHHPKIFAGELQYFGDAVSLKGETNQVYDFQSSALDIPIDPVLLFGQEAPTTSLPPSSTSFTNKVETTAEAHMNEHLHSFSFEAGQHANVEDYAEKNGDPDSALASQSTTSQSTLSSPEDLSCPVCKSFTGGVRRLREHMKCHERNHTCTSPNCDLSFSSMRDLDRHYKSVHQKAILKCLVCSTVIKGGREDNLQRHMRSFHSAHSPDDSNLGASHRLEGITV